MQSTPTFQELVARQHGAFTRSQARAAGFDRNAIARRVRAHEWTVCSPRVLALAGVPITTSLACSKALLDSGPASALSHYTAAALWGLPGLEVEPVHVIVLRGHRAQGTEDSLAVVHTSKHFPMAHAVELDGLAITTPTRTLFDLAASIHPGRLAVLTDRLWSRRLTDGPTLHAMLDDHRRRGRDHAAMRAVLEQRGPGYVPPESGLESRFMALLAEDGQAPMDRQVDLGNYETWLGRVDFIDKRARLIVQVDGEAFHTSLVDRAKDEAQRAALEAAGWTVIQVTAFEIWHRPHKVCERVRDARRRALAAA